MKLGFGLALQQQQKLIMTPELRQAIAILQLPLAELEAYLQEELLNNPMLEVREEEEAPSEAEPTPAEEVTELQATADWLEYLGLEPSGAVPAAPERTYEVQMALEPTLHDHLLEQLKVAELTPGQARIATYLIGSIDDNGYLTLPLLEAAEQLAVPLTAAEHVLHVVQGFEPTGVGARNLQECLRLQAAAVGCDTPLVLALIAAHLDDLAAGRITRIAEVLAVRPTEVQAAADLIRTLDPKPGRRFGRPGETRYVVPDAVVERVGGEYVVLVNDSSVPRLSVSSYYRQVLADPQGVEGDTRKFLEGKLHSALWLMKAIEQRRVTLHRVTETIVRLQRAFFDRGIRHLRPMTLRDVAQELGLHESTISRASSGKYVQTPQGLFELKFFFSSGVEGARGQGVSAESVKRLIQDLIDHEAATAPLSDQELADRLGKQGVVISRRTVAKYREEMQVAPSSKRKRY